VGVGVGVGVSVSVGVDSVGSGRPSMNAVYPFQALSVAGNQRSVGSVLDFCSPKLCQRQALSTKYLSRHALDRLALASIDCARTRSPRSTKKKKGTMVRECPE